MKIFSMFGNYAGFPAEMASRTWSVLPDSVLLRSGKPVFLPDIEHDSYLLHPTLCFKISRLGKRVAARFATRYISEAAPAVIIMSERVASAIKAGETPRHCDLLFDGAVVVGNFIPMDEDFLIRDHAIELSVGNIGEEAYLKSEWRLSEVNLNTAETLACISYYNTIKSGDFLLAGTSPEGLSVRPDMAATALLDHQPLLKFNVK